MRTAAELAANVATIPIGKANIHEDEVAGFFETTLKRADGVVRYACAMSQCLCYLGEHVRTSYVVVDK
jgi:hypothetical protein